MSPPSRRVARKISAPEKEINAPRGEVLSPSEIGYYGRPITKLNKGELISALTELAEMYKDVKEKLKRSD